MNGGCRSFPFRSLAEEIYGFTWNLDYVQYLGEWVTTMADKGSGVERTSLPQPKSDQEPIQRLPLDPDRDRTMALSHSSQTCYHSDDGFLNRRKRERERERESLLG